MNRPEQYNPNASKKRHDAIAGNENVVKPTLYSSVIQTEAKLRQISLSRLEPKPIVKKAGIRKVNFPLTEHVFNYSNLVDVGLNSGPAPITKPKPREVHSVKKPEPKLSDYYQPCFDNIQRIQMDTVKTAPELTVQYDGLAVSRLMKEIDDLVFK